MNNLVQPIAKQAVNYRPAKDGTLEKQVVNMRFDNKNLRSPTQLPPFGEK
jgi:hypothetical protein